MRFLLSLLLMLFLLTLFVERKRGECHRVGKRDKGWNFKSNSILINSLQLGVSFPLSPTEF